MSTCALTLDETITALPQAAEDEIPHTLCSRSHGGMGDPEPHCALCMRAWPCTPAINASARYYLSILRCPPVETSSDSRLAELAEEAKQDADVRYQRHFDLAKQAVATWDEIQETERRAAVEWRLFQEQRERGTAGAQQLDLHQVSHELDAAVQVGMTVEALRLSKMWPPAETRWLPLDALTPVIELLDLPCPVIGKSSGNPCLLKWGHKPDYHQFPMDPS